MEHRSYMRKCWHAYSSMILMVMATFCQPISATQYEVAEERYLTLLQTIPHDSNSFTQGLEDYRGDTIFESTGLLGHSGIKEIDLGTGEVIRQENINNSYFGEGITVVGDSIVMLTWKSEIALIFDINNFSIKDSFTYQGEGWGICFNGHSLVMSNGSSQLSFRDPSSFEIRESITVTWDGEEVERLNELECVDDKIYANVWGRDYIIAINSTTGATEFFVSAKSLSSVQGRTSNEVLNGIAFDHATGGFWITGKNWTKMYLVNFNDSPPSLDNNQPDTSKEATVNEEPTMSLFQILVASLVIMVLFRVKPQQPPSSEEEISEGAN